LFNIVLSDSLQAGYIKITLPQEIMLSGSNIIELFDVTYEKNTEITLTSGYSVINPTEGIYRGLAIETRACSTCQIINANYNFDTIYITSTP